MQVLKLPGDWLLRATDGRINQTELVISVLDNKLTLKNYTLKFHEAFGKWQLTVLTGKKKVKHFDNVWVLVNFYKTHGLPGGVTMKRAIYREKWLVQHDLIKYDKTKDLLGSGNFCDVYKAKFEQTMNHFVDVGVKVCHKSDSERDQLVTEADREAMMALVREGRIMSYYSHENVIQFYGVACDHKPIMIVMEYCTGGGLDYHLQKEGENIEVGERILFCYEAAKGMSYLHRQGCIHRDLAARNCLISNRGTIKIADFGLSDMVNDKSALKQQVPLRWMAPECLVKEPKYSRKSDIWSYGVLIFEVFNLGAKPWPKDDYKRIATWIRRCQMPELPKIMPNEMKELVKKIWNKEPENRPEFKRMVVDLFEMHHDKYRPPEPRLCSTNRLPGVTRCDFDEKPDDTRHRIVDLNQQTEETKTKEVENPDNEDIVTYSTSPTVAENMAQDPPSVKTAEGTDKAEATVSKPFPPLEPEFKPIPEELALRMAQDVPIIPQKEPTMLKPVTEIPSSNRKISDAPKKVEFSTTTTTTTTTTMEKMAGRTTEPPVPQQMIPINSSDDKTGLKKKIRSQGTSQSKKKSSAIRSSKNIKPATKEK